MFLSPSPPHLTIIEPLLGVFVLDDLEELLEEREDVEDDEDEDEDDDDEDKDGDEDDDDDDELNELLKWR